MKLPVSLVPGRLLLRATVGDAAGHGEASLFKLRDRDPAQGVLMSDVFTDKSHRRQRLSECAVASLIGQATWRKWPIVTYVQPHGGGERASAQSLWDFYVRAGFVPWEPHLQAGPLGRLLLWMP